MIDWGAPVNATTMQSNLNKNNQLHRPWKARGGGGGGGRTVAWVTFGVWYHIFMNKSLNCIGVFFRNLYYKKLTKLISNLHPLTAAIWFGMYLSSVHRSGSNLNDGISEHALHEYASQKLRGRIINVPLSFSKASRLKVMNMPLIQIWHVPLKCPWPRLWTLRSFNLKLLLVHHWWCAKLWLLALHPLKATLPICIFYITNILLSE